MCEGLHYHRQQPHSGYQGSSEGILIVTTTGESSNTLPFFLCIGQKTCIEEKEKNDLKVISEKLEVINEQLAMKQKQKRKMLVNTLIIFDICFVLLFILLAILGSPYQSWDYSDPEWSVIGTLWHSFEWVYFKVAPLMIIVITAILGVIFVKRNK